MCMLAICLGSESAEWGKKEWRKFYYLYTEIKDDMHKIEEDSKKIDCYAILDLIRDSLMCLIHSIKCCSCKVKIE